VVSIMGHKHSDMCLTKTLQCEYCKKRITFNIKKSDLEELKNNQLFNFVVFHAEDHAIVISVDGFGNIRRTRVAMINDSAIGLKNALKKEEANLKLELEEIDNLADAFKNFLKQK